ncbi:hypothetical protein [Streptomyces sp. NPDC015125]|uniref:hypothetical protein n=1 Tax=Streptomyces sp. NPDC015125 TaxID=3364938 RepID=UPI0036FB4973
MSEQPAPRLALMRAYLDQARQLDHSFTCACGWSTRDTRYEAHVCPESAGPVGPDEEPTT